MKISFKAYAYLCDLSSYCNRLLLSEVKRIDATKSKPDAGEKMKKVLIINAHQYYSFSEGKLTKSLIEEMESQLSSSWDVKRSKIYALNPEVENDFRRLTEHLNKNF